jgi:hypothetical protein
MTDDRRPKELRIGRLPLVLEAYLAGKQGEERQGIEELWQAVLAEAQALGFIDLWERRDLSCTYWVLLISGVNQPEEMEIASALLTWKHFFAKDSAMLLCIQSSERREFKCATAKFGAVNCPSLIVSDSPEMDEFIEMKSDLLFALQNSKGALQRFLTRIHQMIENGKSLDDVRASLWSEQFWAGIKVVYTEVKGLVGSSVKTSIDFKP